MPTINARPRLIGTTVTALLVLAALVAPTSGLAAPLPGDLTISPSPATFPKTTVGHQKSREFQVGNESGEEVGIEGVGIEGSDAGNFIFNGTSCGGPLPSGQHCSVWVTFAPGSTGAKQATLTVRVDGEQESFEISGESVPPQLSFQPGTYDFGLQYVNSGSSSANFQLTNIGEATVQLNNLDTTGPGHEAFWTGGSDCWSHPLEPGESCSVQVGFGPRDAVPYAAEVRAGVNGYSFTAELTGAGGRPIVEADANPVEFGTATAGGAGVVRTVTLTNSGNLPASFFIGVIAGGDAGSFELLDENCSAAPLMPAASCTAHVRFAPSGPGPKVARLAFFGDTEGGTIVMLIGEGVAPATTLSPGFFDFGSQRAGTRGRARGFLIRNEGTAPLRLGAASVVGTDSDQFLLAGDECTDAVLAPGAGCEVRVRFAPSGAGAKSAKLRIAADGGVVTAALAGTAKPRTHYRHHSRFARRMTLSAHRAK
jgi:trimeric autotransporter adhesin